ncbi:TIGR02186 family protein [Escherichia coli]
MANAARDNGLIYGMAAAAMALFTGWAASVVFRRD